MKLLLDCGGFYKLPHTLRNPARLLVVAVVATCFILSMPLLAASPEKTPAQPTRLVVLAPNLVELLYSLGAGDQIVATTDHADYPASARAIPRVGNYAAISLEKIVALKPDLVLVWDTGTPAADIKKMQQLGLKVIHFQTKTLEDIASQLLQLGELVQQQHHAQQLANTFLQQLTALRQQYQTQQPIRVFYELWDNPLSTISNTAWPQQHLQLCGAKNIFENATAAYPQVGLEQVIAANPALIIQPVSENEPRTLVQWHRWPELLASKNKQIIQPDSDLLHRATLRTLDGVAILCREIAKSRQFYAQVPAASSR